MLIVVGLDGAGGNVAVNAAVHADHGDARVHCFLHLTGQGRGVHRQQDDAVHTGGDKVLDLADLGLGGTLRGDSLDLHVALGGSQVLDTDQVGGIAVRGQVVQGHADHDLVALVAVGVCVCVRVVARRTAGSQAEHHDQRQQHCKDFLHVFLLYCILIYNNGLRRY